MTAEKDFNGKGIAIGVAIEASNKRKRAKVNKNFLFPSAFGISGFSRFLLRR